MLAGIGEVGFFSVSGDDAIQLEALTREFHVLTGASVSFVLEQVKFIPSFCMVQ